MLITLFSLFLSSNRRERFSYSDELMISCEMYVHSLIWRRRIEHVRLNKASLRKRSNENDEHTCHKIIHFFSWFVYSLAMLFDWLIHRLLKWNGKETSAGYYFNFETYFHNKWKCDDAPEGVNLNIPFTSVVFPELSKPTIEPLEERFDQSVI